MKYTSAGCYSKHVAQHNAAAAKSISSSDILGEDCFNTTQVSTDLNNNEIDFGLETDDKASRLHNKTGFIIAHININSVFNKFAHVQSLLESTRADLLFFNESKLGRRRLMQAFYTKTKL